MNSIPYIISILIAQCAGGIGAFFTTNSVGTLYTTLSKPLWNPPSWLFGPVWILLYTLMGIAAALVYQHKGSKQTTRALSLYTVQLALNALWSILFFGMKNPGGSFVEIIILLGFIIVTTILFWRVNTWAGILMLPYIAWVSFATYLNYTIWQLN